MTFKQKQWEQLIGALVKATKDGELTWEQRDADSMLDGFAFVRSRTYGLSTGRTIFANKQATTYELSSDPYGRSPYEFVILDSSGKSPKILAHYKSATTSLSPSLVNLDRDLDTLYKVASSTIEPPEVIVKRLLGELGQE